MKYGLERKSEKLNTTACSSLLSVCHITENRGKRKNFLKTVMEKTVFKTSFFGSALQTDAERLPVSLTFSSLLFYVISFLSRNGKMTLWTHQAS